MPKLNCSVETCAYNENNGCCINAIHVGSTVATKSSSTYCGSFHHRNMEISNDVKFPKNNVYVHCKALNCIYNSDLKCNAEGINIVGGQVYQCEESDCATFVYK